MSLFPSEIITAAGQSQKKWNIRASVTLAQWALESNFGKSLLPGSNNPFGIKAGPKDPFVTGKTKEFVNGRMIITEAKFRKYASFAAAFDDHGRLLSESPSYKKARIVRNNADQFADALTGVYATDPHYGTKLKAIMTKYNLYQYDAPDLPLDVAGKRYYT